MKQFWLYSQLLLDYNTMVKGVKKLFLVRIDQPMPIRLAGRFSQSTGWEHTGRMIAECILCCVEEGSCSFTIDSHTVEVASGQGIFIPAGAFYAPVTQSGCCYQYLRFDAEMEATDAPLFSDRSYHYSEKIEHSPAVFCVPKVFQTDPVIDFSLETIIDEMTRSNPVSKVKMNMAFFSLLIRLTEQLAGQSVHSLAYEMERYIRENAGHPLTLSQLSERFGYTKQYVIRIFRKQFHTTPTAFINDTKLSLAIRQLTESDSPIEEIAHRCGFEDANYFSRQFKKKFGLSPSEYRKSAMGV